MVARKKGDESNNRVRFVRCPNALPVIGLIPFFRSVKQKGDKSNNRRSRCLKQGRHLDDWTHPLFASRTRKFTIPARLINFCWFFFKWGLALALVAAALAAVPYFYRHMDDTIRLRVAALFAEHYPDLVISVRSAELTENGILVRGLSIVERDADGPQAELANLDEMLLVCQTDLPTLVRSTPPIREIIVRHPTIRATRRPDGTWSAARLFPLPKFGDQPPDINIEAGSLELFDPQKNPAGSLTLRDGNLKVTRGEAAASGGRRRLNIRGQLAGDHLQRIELEGTFDPTGGAWEFTGKIDGLEVSPELVRALPGDVPPKLNLLESLRGQANGQFHVRLADTDEEKLTFLVTGQFSNGRVDDPRLSYPLTDLQATFRFDQRGFAVDELQANSGPTTLRLDFERAGYGEDCPLTLAGEARHLQLDPQLLEMFPDSCREAWSQFMPAGEIDLEVKLAYDGRAWNPDVSVQCHDVAFCYHKFPYRLEHGTGQVTLKHKLLKVGVTAFSGGEEVLIDGEIHNVSSDWHGFLEVKGRHLPLDQKLFRALPDKPREVANSLRPGGNVGLRVRYQRGPQPGTALDRFIWIDVNNCSVNFDKFAYPLTNVRGSLEIINDVWTFKNFEGTNDTARVRCSGSLKPTAAGNLLVLNFTGDDVPLEEELRDALAPAARRLWNDVKPRGVIHLDAQVQHLTSQGQPRIWVQAEPLGETASIEPVQFPYRLDKVQGVFTYNNTDGRLDMQDLRAEHGHDTRISGRGACVIDARGGWNLHLERLSAGRLYADRDVLQALPPRLKKAVTDLHLSGPVHMSGSFDLASTGKPDVPLQSRWNLDFDLQQVRMHCGIPIENINGKINLAGEFDGRQLRSQGELAVDSLTFKDFQFTEVRGPFWIDDRQVLLGAWAAPARDGQPERHITTRLFGGYVVGDGWVTLEAAPRYNLEATLAGADLARCGQQCAPARGGCAGKWRRGSICTGKAPASTSLAARA